jgi:hypothetical protein
LESTPGPNRERSAGIRASRDLVYPHPQSRESVDLSSCHPDPNHVEGLSSFQTESFNQGQNWFDSLCSGVPAGASHPLKRIESLDRGTFRKGRSSDTRHDARTAPGMSGRSQFSCRYQPCSASAMAHTASLAGPHAHEATTDAPSCVPVSVSQRDTDG